MWSFGSRDGVAAGREDRRPPRGNHAQHRGRLWLFSARGTFRVLRRGRNANGRLDSGKSRTSWLSYGEREGRGRIILGVRGISCELLRISFDRHERNQGK